MVRTYRVDPSSAATTLTRSEATMRCSEPGVSFTSRCASAMVNRMEPVWSSAMSRQSVGLRVRRTIANTCSVNAASSNSVRTDDVAKCGRVLFLPHTVTGHPRPLFGERRRPRVTRIRTFFSSARLRSAGRATQRPPVRPPVRPGWQPAKGAATESQSSVAAQSPCVHRPRPVTGNPRHTAAGSR